MGRDVLGFSLKAGEEDKDVATEGVRDEGAGAQEGGRSLDTDFGNREAGKWTRDKICCEGSDDVGLEV